MTEAGSILGTAQYLAPEQAKGEPVDERTDLYSVGVVFYEMLTGALPFRGDSAVTVALKHVNELPPEPAEVVPGLPYSLNQIVLKALAKDPDQRYRTAAEFSADLVAARSGGPLLAAAYDPSLDRTIVQSAPTGGEATTRVLPKAAAGAAVGAAGVAAAGGNGSGGRRRKRSPWPWIALVVFLLIAVAAGVLIWHSFFNGTSTVAVPSVVGQAQAAATSQLQGDGFVVKPHDDYSDQFGVGLVTRQQPTSGAKLAKGGTVDIWVSRGAAHITLINLSGFTPSAAASWLTQNHLVGKELFGTSTTVGKGKVYKQSPVAGSSVLHGSTVSYWVSKGQPQVSVPDLSGLDQSQATTAIQGAGLLVGTVDQSTSTSVPVGDVISQFPAANTLVAKGSTVSFVISTGTPTPTSSPSGSPSGTPTPTGVPSVVTMPQTQAEQLLTNDGFKVKVKTGTSTLGSGYVYDQSPAGGTTAAPGSTVTIWVTK